MCAILSFMEALNASPGDQQSNRITPVSGQMAQLGQWAIREVRNALGPMGLKRGNGTLNLNPWRKSQIEPLQ